MADAIHGANLTRWFQDHVGSVTPPLSFTAITGGRSNLTFLVADGVGARWVLRRPPLTGVLPSAHDMGREHRIMSALAASDVPVPACVGYEADPGVTGSSFFVMEYVDGHVLRTREDAQGRLGVDARARAGRSVVDVLVELHQVDPDAVGLGELSRKDAYLSRQLRRWKQQLDATAHAGGRKLALLDKVHGRLVAGAPPQQTVAIVHGDFRIDNVILSDVGDVSAVLDWELCTLGDPLADVGLLAAYWRDADDMLLPLGSAATTADGFPGRDEAVAAYAQRSPLDLAAFDYYLAFAHWKLAVILEGVFSRFSSGAYGDTGEDDWRRLESVVPELGTHALRLLA